MSPCCSLKSNPLFLSLALFGVLGLGAGLALTSSSSAATVQDGGKPPPPPAGGTQKPGDKPTEKPGEKPGGEKGERGGPGHEQAGGLEGAMKGIKNSMKRLGKELDKKDPATSWKIVCDIEQNVISAKLGMPEKLETIPEADRPAFLAGFRTKLSEMLKGTCDLEAAVLANKFDDATKIYNDILRPMEKAGHSKYKD